MKTARLKVVYEGENISEDISKYLISFNYTDNLTDRADDVTINLDNGTGVWINEWYPTKGSTLDISLLLDYDGIKKEVHFGKFNIDELEASFKPNTFTIKAVAALLEGNFKDELRSKSYTKISLKQLVTGIGKANGLTVEYKAKANPIIEYIMKHDQSDANFLYKLLTKYGLIFKVNDKRIIVYEDTAEGSALKIDNYSSISFKEKTWGVYAAVKITCKHPKKKEAIDYLYNDSKIKTGKTLIIKGAVSSIAEAELIAKARLKNENAQATTGSLTMLGIGDIFSGQKIAVKDVGVYSGEYKVERVTHDLSRSGYSNSLEFISL